MVMSGLDLTKYMSTSRMQNISVCLFVPFKNSISAFYYIFFTPCVCLFLEDGVSLNVCVPHMAKCHFFDAETEVAIQ